jgi:ribosomal protein L40E
VRYSSRHIDLQNLAKSVEDFSRSNGFETRTYYDQRNPPSWFQIQSLKTGVGRTILGARRCLDIIIRGNPDDFEVTIGSSDWGKNIAASVIAGTLTLGLGWVWAGASAVAYKVFEDKLWSYINGQIELLASSRAPAASSTEPQSSMMFCRECGSRIPRGSRFCEKCGSKLT